MYRYPSRTGGPSGKARVGQKKECLGTIQENGRRRNNNRRLAQGGRVEEEYRKNPTEEGAEEEHRATRERFTQ